MLGFYVDEKLVFPGAAVDGAAFDFEQVDAEAAEGFEGGKESARTMSQAHGDGHFARIRGRRCGFRGGTEQDEAGEIFWVVLDVGGEDNAGVMFGGAAAGDGCGRFVAASEGFANAAGGVFGGDALEVRMCGEETFALRESHGMRGHGADGIEGGAGAADQVVFDGEDGFGGDGERAF